MVLPFHNASTHKWFHTPFKTLLPWTSNKIVHCLMQKKLALLPHKSSYYETIMGVPLGITKLKHGIIQTWDH